MTSSTRYVIRARTDPRLYYAGFQQWVPTIEQAKQFEFLTIAEGCAIMQLGLTELDYAVELMTAVHA